VTEENGRDTPVMLHRAIVGSMERFIGILIENHAGAMPLWLSPVQVVVATITESHNEYANTVVQMLKKQGIRVEADLRNEKINRKIREHTMQKVPYIAVIGDQERDANQVAVRLRGNENLGSLPVTSFLQRLLDEVASRA
jgi:threonyl-tRNA synthetase